MKTIMTIIILLTIGSIGCYEDIDFETNDNDTSSEEVSIQEDAGTEDSGETATIDSETEETITETEQKEASCFWGKMEYESKTNLCGVSTKTTSGFFYYCNNGTWLRYVCLEETKCLNSTSNTTNICIYN